MNETIRRKPRILIVIAHFDENRTYRGRPNFMPQGVGHAFLAGAFDPASTDIRLYSEFHSGPLEDEAMLAWPDMLVLTGVTSAFDRMKHLTAYTRTLAPKAVVVAGGPAVRNLPLVSREIFDYACDDDIEELQSICAEVFGPDYVAEVMEPRFELLTWNSPVNYVESSRYCNFKCSFCALSGEKRPYQNYDSAYIERQIRKQTPDRYLLFIDNNFTATTAAPTRASSSLSESCGAKACSKVGSRWSRMTFLRVRIMSKKQKQPGALDCSVA